MTFLLWHKGLFLVGKILINERILWDPFHVGVPLIRVSRGAQDVSLYIHAWGLSKATSNPSKVYPSPSASFRQVLNPSIHSSHSSVINLKAHLSALRWNCRLYGVVHGAQARSSGSLGLSALPRIYQTSRITLIKDIL